jgi:hypothetical protein
LSWLVASFLACTSAPDRVAHPAPADPEAAAPAEEPRADTVLYVVRHAEKLGGSSDPGLTDEGVLRAGALAHTLSPVALSAVHSTETARTLATAAPTALDHALEVQRYDASDPDGLVERVVALGGHHLIVGHSNTIAGLVEAAGGDPGPVIGDGEFDRLYVVLLPGTGEPRTVQLAYGAPSAR